MMTYARRYLFVVPILLGLEVCFAQEAKPPIASQAVVHYTFGEESGAAQDSATVGQGPDQGSLMNDPVRVPSPFWNQTGKKALQLDAARQQFIEIADSADVDAPIGITLSMFVVNLTESADPNYHGLFAKRGNADGKFSANYGINFQMPADNFQVYIHDGTDYRVASYSSNAALPIRKLAYVTATYTAGDAPGQDADTDVDDLRMQYFINGEPLNPKGVARGFVSGSEAWTLDVNLAGLLSSLPTTIGRSEVVGEYTSCVIGDFRIFPRALSPEEVKQLFLEVAGADVNALIAADQPAPAALPIIKGLSQPGVQVGRTTQLVIDGTNLSPGSMIAFPLPEVRFDVAEGSTPDRLILNVAVPPETVPGLYPLWVKSQSGMSLSTVLAIDRLPQMPLQSSVDKPATLPGAFFGTLSGGQQQTLYFAGKTGQRVVADVELKRLGGAANPVLEIKSPSGAPLAIGWGQNSLRRDARAECTLKADGIYSIELHDLTFNAPGTNVFRLKVGDLKLVDGLIPAAAHPGQVEVEPVGSGFAAGTRLTGQVTRQTESNSGLLSLNSEAGFSGSLPSMGLSRGTELIEPAGAADGSISAIDVTFAPSTPPLVGISGRVAVRGENDRYLLGVAPGQKLRFTLLSDSLGSNLEGEVRLMEHPSGKPLAQTSDQPANGDPSLEYVVPAGVTLIQVHVRDLFGRGDARAFYRLVIEPADQPKFALILNTPIVNIPEDGSAMVELQVVRTGYAGAIQLSVVGDDAVKVSSNQIAPNKQGKTLLRLVRSNSPPGTLPSLLRIVGESVGLDPSIKRTAVLQTGVTAPTFTDTMAVATTPSSGLSVELQQVPAVLFRGTTNELPVTVHRQPGHATASMPVRFLLDSTEPVRKRDPNNPAAGNFPLVSIGPAFLLPAEPEVVTLKLSVPLEVVEPTIDFVIRAEATPHSFSDRVLAKAYSQPFHAEVKSGVAPKLDDATLSFAGEVDHQLTGILQRTPGFTAPVEVTLGGLPAGYTVQPHNVTGDQDKFSLTLRGPKVTAATAIPNIKLRVTSKGNLLVPESPVNLNSIP